MSIVPMTTRAARFATAVAVTLALVLPAASALAATPAMTGHVTTVKSSSSAMQTHGAMVKKVAVKTHKVMVKKAVTKKKGA